MGLNCGAKCLKVLLIIFNILFWLCGAVILGLGIWLAVDDDAFNTLDILNPEGMDYPVWKAAVYMMIGVGSFVFIVGFLGWAGACCENSCMLVTYCVLAGIALLLEIICATLALVFRDSINAVVEEQMYQDIVLQYTGVEDTNNSFVVSWNNFQTQMKCCGSYNFTDWHDNPNFEAGWTYPVPWTCCKMSFVSEPPNYYDIINPDLCFEEGSSLNATDQPNFDHLNNMGCHEALKKWINDKSAIIYGVMFGFMAIQILGIVFACFLRCSIEDDGYDVK